MTLDGMKPDTAYECKLYFTSKVFKVTKEDGTMMDDDRTFAISLGPNTVAGAYKATSCGVPWVFVVV